MCSIINVEKLSFSYEHEKILKNIDFRVDKGEYLALIGPNGSGKSTFFKLLLGFLQPDSGSIGLYGKDIKHFNEWTKVGYMSQQVKDFNNSFPATAREIVGVNLYKQMGFFKVFRHFLEKKIDRALDLVDMYEYKHRQIGSLSGGQKQRVFIARTLVTEPQLVLLDEPLSGLDREAQQDFYKILSRLHKDLGITILMISHDLHVIGKEVDRIICFGEKQIFSHRADEFSYSDYIKQLQMENQVPIPRHKHRTVD